MDQMEGKMKIPACKNCTLLYIRNENCQDVPAVFSLFAKVFRGTAKSCGRSRIECGVFHEMVRGPPKRVRFDKGGFFVQ